MKSHLKVKVFSLSKEMTYIRRQEDKWKNKARIARQRQKESLKYCEDNFWSLRDHRDTLKQEARTTHLAYGFMRGRSYAQMENTCYGVFKGYGVTEPRWSHIEREVERFSKDEPKPQVYLQMFAEWLEAAKAWYEGNTERIPAVQNGRNAARSARLNDPDYQAMRKQYKETMEKWGRATANLVKQGWVKV